MKFLILLIVWLLSACNPGSLPPDYAENYAKLGYRNLEMVSSDGSRWLGNLPIQMIEGQSLEGLYFDVVGSYKGTLTFYSQGCPWINWTVQYDGVRRFLLKDIIPQPVNCQINIVETPDQLNGLQHNVVEAGVIDLFAIPAGRKPAKLSYLASSEFGIKRVETVGNSVIQRMDTSFTFNDQIHISVPSQSGNYAMRSSCDVPAIQSAYSSSQISLSLKQLYASMTPSGKNCDFNFVFVPNDEPDSYYGRLAVNVFSRNVVPLEYAKYEIYSGHKIRATGAAHIAVICINDLCSYQDGDYNTVRRKDYNPLAVYFIRQMTMNGRKSVYAIQGEKVIWW